MYKTVRLLKYISAIQVDLSPPLKKWGIFLLNNYELQNYLYYFIDLDWLGFYAMARILSFNHIHAAEVD